MTKSLARPVVFVPVFVLILAAAGYLGPKLNRRRFTYTASGDSPQAVRSFFPLDRKLPQLTRDRVGGETTLKALLDGQPGGLIVNFWATWCPPCVEELPSLDLLARQLGKSPDKNLPRLVAISVDDKATDVFNFYKTLDYSVSLTTLHDKEGELARSVGTTRFPETYWIGPDGTVLHKWIGPQNWVAAEVLDRIAALRRPLKK